MCLCSGIVCSVYVNVLGFKTFFQFQTIKVIIKTNAFLVSPLCLANSQNTKMMPTLLPSSQIGT